MFRGFISEPVMDHFTDCKNQFPEQQIVMLSLVGSQNYNLATNTSDYDTKCCILPSWQDIIQAHQPYAHTFIRENGEHIDFTDFRSMMNILKKQNINFIEQLFTEEYFINEWYYDEVKNLRIMREEIAHYNPCKAVQTMAGIAKSKEKRIFRPLNEEKNEIFNEFGYHPKELAQLYRITCFLTAYTNNNDFADCLKSSNRDVFLDLKTTKYDVDIVQDIVKAYMSRVIKLEDDFLRTHETTHLPVIDLLLEETSESILKKYLKRIIY